jgi:hypothetical protein
MCALLAVWPLGAESAQVKRTYLFFLVVFECAVGAEWTETTVVVGARGSLGFRIDVEVEAVVAVGACLGSSVV